MSEDVIQPVNEVLLSGYVGQGPKVDEFETILGDYFGNPHVNAVNSCTSGLHLALQMVKDEVRKEILTTPQTCTATNLAIVANELKIKWVDVDLNTCNLDLTDLRRKINPNTLAIMLVHWGGYPVDLDEVKDIQDQCFQLYGHRPPVIEDCAHAFGSSYKGKLLGNHGNICVFSFQAIKHLTTCDGGCIVSPDDGFHKRAKLLRWYGLDRTSSADFRCQQDIEEYGFKFHMNDLNAVIGIENFKHIESILQKHVDNAKYYYSELKDCDGVKLLENKPDRTSTSWIFTLLVDKRDDFIKWMKECGVEVSRVHDRNDKHSCLKEFKVPLPNTDLLASQMICIPCGWWVNDEDRTYIVECIKKGW